MNSHVQRNNQILMHLSALPTLKLSVIASIAADTELVLAETMFPALFFILAHGTPAVIASAKFK